jgi:hypothetical protein
MHKNKGLQSELAAVCFVCTLARQPQPPFSALRLADRHVARIRYLPHAMQIKRELEELKAVRAYSCAKRKRTQSLCARVCMAHADPAPPPRLDALSAVARVGLRLCRQSQRSSPARAQSANWRPRPPRRARCKMHLRCARRKQQSSRRSSTSARRSATGWQMCDRYTAAWHRLAWPVGFAGAPSLQPSRACLGNARLTKNAAAARAAGGARVQGARGGS